MKCIAPHPYQPHVPLPENGKVVYIRGCASEPFDTPIGDCMDRYSKEGSVIQQCETCDTDNCNIGQIRETNLGLVSTDLNKVRFDSEEMDRLKECIGNAIITRSDQNNRPHFEKTLKGPGYLIATVANNGTEDWLRSHADYIGDSCSLTFKVKGDVHPAYIYKGIVYGPLMEDFLRHVDIQNDGLLASNWTIIKHTPRRMEGVIYNLIIVSVDQESANVLNKIGGNIFFKMGIINLTPYVEDVN